MVDPIFVYVGGVTVLFFFWIYGIVAFVRDMKNKVIPAYRQYRSDDEGRDEVGEEAITSDGGEERPGDGDDRDELNEQRLREIYGS